MKDMAVKDLPTDVATLQLLLHQAHQALTEQEDTLTRQAQTLAQQEQALAEQKETLAEQRQELHELHRLIHAYQEEKRLAAARLYAPKSEQEARQYYLFNEAEVSSGEAEVQACDPEEDTTEVKAHRRRGGRKPLPESLPRIDVIHDLSTEEQQCSCGCQKQKIGEEVTEQLDIIPAKVRVLRHRRFKYGCKHCDTPPETAALPAQLLPKSQVSAGFMAYVITSKYADGLPLYRQCHILGRGGVEIARNSLCHQVVQVGERMQPVINLLQEQALDYPILQMDETTVQVLKEPGRKAQSKSHMWVMRGGPPGQESIVYHYDPGRGQSVAKRLLAGYQGYLQTDAWHAYDAVHSDEVTAVGCWAHARRKFKDAEKALPKKQRRGATHKAIGFIQKLYAIEKRHKASTEEQRHNARQQESIPILNQFKGWLEKQSVNPGSKLGKAIQYTLTHWPRLLVYCQDGRLEIDNNGIENKIRPFAVGRKNWLFSTSQAGAKASANLYSLIETAKAHGLNEYDYLKWVFAKLPEATTVEDFEALLPWNINPTVLVNWVYR